MTITTYTDREIALKAQLAAMTLERDEYQRAADKMAMEHKVERDTLRQQLAEQRQFLATQMGRKHFYRNDAIALRQQLEEAQALIEASRKQEPVLYQRRMKPDYGPSWSEWDDCSEATFKQCLTVPKLHDWTHEARALFAAPVVADDVLKDAERLDFVLQQKTWVNDRGFGLYELMRQDEDEDYIELGHGSSPREAIDAAMQGGQQ